MPDVATRTTEQIKAEIDKLLARAEELSAKKEAATEENPFTTDEQAELDLIVKDQIPALELEYDAARKAAEDAELAETKERVKARTKAHGEHPRNAAPAIIVKGKTRKSQTINDAMRAWLASGSELAANDYSVKSRAASVGINTDAKRLLMPVDWTQCPYTKRRNVLTTNDSDGDNTGEAWTQETYSSNLIKYLVHDSPLLGFLPNVSVPDDGVHYLRIKDDTAMMSRDTTGADGSVNAEQHDPSIPETEFLTLRVPVKAKSITSGFQKVSWEEMKASGFNIPAEMAESSAFSHARKMASDLILGTGDGVTNVQGIRSVCSAFTPTTATTLVDIVEEMYDNVKPQYRNSLIVISNSRTQGKFRRSAKDTTGRSLMGTLVQDSLEFKTVNDKPWVINEYCPNDEIYLYATEFYRVAMVPGEHVQNFSERFWPHFGYASCIAFSGVHCGPDVGNVAQKYTITGLEGPAE